MSVALPIFPKTTGEPPASPPRAPDAAVRPGALFDSHGRVIRDVRLSITDRCNFRCVYCMDPDFRYMPKRELLALDEYVRIARILISLGIDKVRITGGEPTLYPHLVRLIREIAALGEVDLAMTTNGSLMDEEAALRWREAGLRRITLSIDSLKPDRLRAITRSDTTIESTIRAIRAAHAAGLGPVKVNAVIMRGVNDDEVADFADFAIEHGIDMRLIEFMPLDSSRAWKREDVVEAREMIERISRRHALIPNEDERPDSTSMNFRFDSPQSTQRAQRKSIEDMYRTNAPGDGHPRPRSRSVSSVCSVVNQPRIGIIAPVSRPFCGACSRLRITADGKIRPCLFSTCEWDVRALLRSGANDEAIERFIIDATWTKQRGHGIGSESFAQPQRTMSAIGG